MRFSLFSLSDDNGLFYVEFVPQDVGTYIMDVYILGQKIPESPIFYKVYDSGSVLTVSCVSSLLTNNPQPISDFVVSWKSKPATDHDVFVDF